MDDKEIIRILELRRYRDQKTIAAMQKKLGSNFIKSFLWRKAWRSKTKSKAMRGDNLRITIINLLSWLRYAHDCQDPAIGCSCHGSFRFPIGGVNGNQ